MRVSKRARTACLAAAVVAGLPIGFAVAQSGDDPVVVVDGVAIHDGPDNGQTPESAASPMAPPATASGLPDGVSARGMLGEVWSEGSTDDKNVIGSAPPPERLVKVCREDPAAESSCGVALAMDDGSLKPGSYSDPDLAAAVAEAGYEWKG